MQIRRKKMAKAQAVVKVGGTFVLKVLIGLLFICIGIQGISNPGNANDLYRAIDNNTIDIILGIVLLICGFLIAVPSFIKGIKPEFTKYSTLIVLVVWVFVIVFSDFVYGLNNLSGERLFIWLETLIYHLLILYTITRIAK